jgi:PAS domain-containing protein
MTVIFAHSWPVAMQKLSAKAGNSSQDGATANCLPFENTLDALVVVQVNGEICEVNKMACVMFGYQRSELIGANVALLTPRQTLEIHRQDESEKDLVLFFEIRRMFVGVCWINQWLVPL